VKKRILKEILDLFALFFLLPAIFVVAVALIGMSIFTRVGDDD